MPATTILNNQDAEDHDHDHRDNVSVMTTTTTKTTANNVESKISPATVTRPKQVLRDYCRYKRLHGPVYYLTQEEKRNLHKYYTVQLLIDDVIYAKGIGLSRRNAEFKAALDAIRLFYNEDPDTILDLIKRSNNRSFGTLSRRLSNGKINRSFSVDYISKANRSGSFASMAIDHFDGQQSLTPSMIDGIDSITLKSGSLTPNNDQSNKCNSNQHIETSSDEGVSSEDSDKCSNSSTTISSPKLNSPDRIVSDSKSKKFNLFPSSLMLLNTLRNFSRRSFRRSSRPLKNSEYIENEPSSSNSSTLSSASLSSSSRPTSSSSSSSSSTSSSSAISSDSVISSSTTTNGKDLYDEILNEDTAVTAAAIINSSLIAESIIEEEEEEEEQPKQPRLNNDVHHNNNNECVSSSSTTTTIDNRCKNDKQCCHNNNNNHNNIIRSYSSSLLSSKNYVCSHNHFSIYGPLLCNSNSTENCSTIIETSPSAILLKYCIRMYLSPPYYDINFDNQQFWATCRVIMTNNNLQQQQQQQQLNRNIPEQYIDHHFTAKGNGETLRIARNMAAKLIIDKLIAANLFYEK